MVRHGFVLVLYGSLWFLSVPHIGQVPYMVPWCSEGTPQGTLEHFEGSLCSLKFLKFYWFFAIT